MGRWAQNRVPVIVGLVLVGGALAWTGWAYRLPAAERGDALALVGIALGLVGVLQLVVQLGCRRRPADARPVAELAGLLAQAVDGQWRKEATERRLLTPDPIPIRWSLSDLAVTGSVEAAVGAPERPPAFPPLPQQARITEADLQAGGGRAELQHVYAGLASGRVVVVGAPGAGKTGTAILLLLDALAHRDRLDDTQRARVPVPVLLTARGWDPSTCSVRDWLRDQLTATYPLFGHRGGRAEAVALVDARDKVALILDGLDEMDATLRPAALQALSEAPFRVVVLTRSQEMIRAASSTWLVGAVAVHLRDIPGAEAADYLQRTRTGPPPAGWTDLLTDLREHPDGVLARGLSTPLTLTLLRDTYQSGDDVRALLDPTQCPTTDALEHHLIARVLPAAYTPRPGRPPPRYTEQQARQTLSLIARKMGKDRDLAWWHIPHWAPTAPRVLASGLVGGLAGVFSFGISFGLMAALMMGPLVGLMSGSGVRLGTGRPQLVRIANLRASNWRQALQYGPIGPVYGFMAPVYGFMGGSVFWSAFGPRAGLAGGFAVALVVGLGYGLLGAFTERGTGAGIPMGPREVWRNNQLSALVNGIVLGIPLGIAFGLMAGLGVRPAPGSSIVTFWLPGLAAGLTGGLVLGIVGQLVCSMTWMTTVAWFSLHLRSRLVPAVSLMPFLEDARKRDILRTVGAVYQFRHARLQDQLAAQTTANSPTVHGFRPLPARGRAVSNAAIDRLREDEPA